MPIDIIGTPPPDVTTIRGVKPKHPLTYGYVRVSTEGQVLSPKAQVKVIRRYAQLNGMTIDRFAIEQKSAKSLKGRPELQHILALADDGQVGHVIVQDITRLFRSVREALNEFHRLEDKGVVFHSAAEHIDATTADGELMRTFKLALGQHERRRLGERTKRVLHATKQPIPGTGEAHDSKAKRGKLLVGAPPYGFRWRRKKLV